MTNGEHTTTVGPLRSIPTPARYPLVSLVIIMVALYGLTTPNPLETVWTCGLLLILLKWFWWREQPGILLFCLIIPFLEIHTTLLEANQNSLTLDQLFFGTGGKTFWMSSFSLLAVAMGIRAIWSLTNNRSITIPIERIKDSIVCIHQQKLVLAFVGASFIGQAIDILIPYGSSLRQLEVYALGVSEVLLFTIAVKFMLDRKHLWMVVGIFTYLIVVSFYSFFSSWKDPLTVLLIASLIRVTVFDVRQVVRLAPILIPAVFLVFIWQNIKGEYRQFLNGGKFSQQVVVTQGEALNKFQELALNTVTSANALDNESLDATYRRIGYLEYFSNAAAKVPREIPHERGKLLQSNLEFSLVPRFLSPNKGVKDDKAKVEKYTDFYFGEYGGSSFSLGHYCEAYIDWGPIGMVLQLFLYGVLGGLLFLLALNRTASFTPLLSLGILWIVIKPWGTFQQDMVTLTGTLFWGAVCHLFLFFPFYRWVNGWVKR